MAHLLIWGETREILAGGLPAGSLAAAIIRLLKDKDLALQFGKAGRDLVEQQWTIDAMVRGIDRVYDELLKAERRSNDPG